MAPPEGIPKLQRLQQVETMIQQGMGLEDATQLILTLSDATMGDAAIALALYCFLSTPGDFPPLDSSSRPNSLSGSRRCGANGNDVGSL